MAGATTWIENTTSKYDHGGAGWEFGTCVWSPAQDRRGAEGKYKLMRQVSPNDRVVNCCDRIICGVSTVASSCITTHDGPPNPGPWAYARSFHRFSLVDYEAFPAPASLDSLIEANKEAIQADIEADRPKYYLFSLYPQSEFNPDGKIVLAQGRFLARATPALVRMLAKLLEIDETTLIPSQHPSQPDRPMQ